MRELHINFLGKKKEKKSVLLSFLEQCIQLETVCVFQLQSKTEKTCLEILV